MLKVPSGRLVKLGIETVTPGLQGEWYPTGSVSLINNLHAVSREKEIPRSPCFNFFSLLSFNSVHIFNY